MSKKFARHNLKGCILTIISNLTTLHLVFVFQPAFLYKIINILHLFQRFLIFKLGMILFFIPCGVLGFTHLYGIITELVLNQNSS